MTIKMTMNTIMFLIMSSSVNAQDFKIINVLGPSPVQPNQIIAGDLDSNNQVDVIGIQQTEPSIFWYPNYLTNVFNRRFGDIQPISTNGFTASFIAVGDMEGDGDEDLIACSTILDQVVWFENRLDEMEFRNFADPVILIQNNGRPSRLLFEDLDNDDDPDLIINQSLGDNIIWYENRSTLQSPGDFTNGRLVANQIGQPGPMILADIRRDGDLDLVVYSGSADRIAYSESQFSQGTKGFDDKITIIEGRTNVISMDAADFNGDNYPDLVVGSFMGETVTWYENRLDKEEMDFSTGREIESEGRDFSSIVTNDLDLDGDPDIIAAVNDNNQVVWYENRLREPDDFNFSSRKLIQNDTILPTSIILEDLDRDGDDDVVTAAWEGGDLTNPGSISWTENRRIASQPDDGMERVLDQAPVDPSYISSGDLDGDGDKEILTAIKGDQSFNWYELNSENGIVRRDRRRIITDQAMNPEFIEACDLNRDGRNDLLTITKDDHTIGWFENVETDDLLGFPEFRVITTELQNPTFLIKDDFDNDQFDDIIAVSEEDDRLVWFRNLEGEDGTTSYSSMMEISARAFGTSRFEMNDLDQDGDNDFVFDTSFNLVWLENITTDSANLVFQENIITNSNGQNAFAIFDYDNDADDDIVMLTDGLNSSEFRFFLNNKRFQNPEINFDETLTFPFDDVENIRSFTVSDYDQDLDMDIITEANGRLVVFENGKFGLANFFDASTAIMIYDTIGPYRLIDNSGEVNSLTPDHQFMATDMDGDGDDDYLYYTTALSQFGLIINNTDPVGFDYGDYWILNRR